MLQVHAFILLALCTAELYAIPPHVLEVIPPEVLELIHHFRGKCAHKFDLTDDDIDNYKVGNSEERYQCYMNCMLLESKWMSADGTINYDTILAEIHSDVKPYLERAFSKCRNIEDSTEPCGKAFNFNNCIAAADPVHYFLP